MVTEQKVLKCTELQFPAFHASLNAVAFCTSHLPSCSVVSTLPLAGSEHDYCEWLRHLLQRARLALD